MEQSNSEPWHRWFIQNFVFLLVNSDMADYLQRGGGAKKRYQHRVDPYSADTILYLRPIQGHSGGKHIDPTVQDNVLLPSDFAECTCHVGSSHALHSIVQSGLIPGGKDIKKGRHAVLFTAVNPMLIDQHRERDYGVTKRRIAVCKHTWKDIKTQCIGVIWGLLRERDCSSIKHDPTESSFTTHCLRCASRRWWSGSQEKNCTVKHISLLLYRKELYWNQACSVDARTQQAMTREHPSTVLASTKKIVTVERTTKVDAVKLTSGSKDCPNWPSKSKIKPARKQSKSWFISSRRILEKRCKPTWSKITRSTHSAKSRRTWSAAWETRSSSICARSLPKYSATTV